MFNFLPQAERQAIIYEYRLRLAVVSLFFLASLCLMAFIALTPSLFLSYNKEETALKNYTSLKEEIKSATADDFSAALKFAGKKAAALMAANQSPYSYEIISGVIRDKTAGIKITGVSVKAAEGSGNSREVTIIGEASNREALLSFAQTLRQEKSFADVTVPVSNFAPAEDINFSILAKTK